MNRPVPLIRRFTAIPQSYQDGDVELDAVWSILGRGERTEWSALHEAYRCVILADAGAGKTFELKAEAERLAARGRPSFFIRIEDIDEAFGEAFEVGDRQRLLFKITLRRTARQLSCERIPSAERRDRCRPFRSR